MEILDKHFIKLPKKKKSFVILIGTGYFLVALVAYMLNLTTIVESLLLLMVGILYTEMLKLQYRVEFLERKKKK